MGSWCFADVVGTVRCRPMGSVRGCSRGSQADCEYAQSDGDFAKSANFLLDALQSWAKLGG